MPNNIVPLLTSAGLDQNLVGGVNTLYTREQQQKDSALLDPASGLFVIDPIQIDDQIFDSEFIQVWLRDPQRQYNPISGRPLKLSDLQELSQDQLQRFKTRIQSWRASEQCDQNQLNNIIQFRMHLEGDQIQSMARQLATQHEQMIVPDEFICPYSNQFINDPVAYRTSQGVIHAEKNAVIEWLDDGNDLCPKTSSELQRSNLTTADRDFCRRLQQFKRENAFLVNKERPVIKPSPRRRYRARTSNSFRPYYSNTFSRGRSPSPYSSGG